MRKLLIAPLTAALFASPLPSQGQAQQSKADQIPRMIGVFGRDQVEADRERLEGNVGAIRRDAATACSRIGYGESQQIPYGEGQHLDISCYNIASASLEGGIRMNITDSSGGMMTFQDYVKSVTAISGKEMCRIYMESGDRATPGSERIRTAMFRDTEFNVREGRRADERWLQQEIGESEAAEAHYLCGQVIEKILRAIGWQDK